MGQQDVGTEWNEEKYQQFLRALLADVWAIEQMLAGGMFETGVRRIGAEQEMFLVYPDMEPAPISAQVLQNIADPRFTTELAKFNLEANLTPHEFRGSCLSDVESELQSIVRVAEEGAASQKAAVLLAGILPTLTMSDLSLENMSDVPRYRELNHALCQLRGSKFSAHIKGLDEIHVEHENMMLEACNTSFQVHLQVGPEEYVNLYNAAQAIAAPIIALAANSPVLFGRRLWAETRVALFQHSVDERSRVEHARYRSPRVTFGERWLQRSVIELFREQIVRFRVILTHHLDEPPSQVLERGGIPLLSALRLHNGTVWRWNRPCYGIFNGKPHLRIEHRVLPSGPTVRDEVANAAMFLGLTVGLTAQYGPVDRVLNFERVKENFYAAARYGLDAQLAWNGGRSYPAGELILNELLPIAHSGLKANSVDDADIDQYLGIIRERVSSRQTGSRWFLHAYEQAPGTIENRVHVAAHLLYKRQKNGSPVSTWQAPDAQELSSLPLVYRTVGQIMSTRLFTVKPTDVVDYVASIMHWEKVRHVPVEDEEGQLVGLVSQRHLLLLLAQGSALNRAQGVPVHRVMKRDLITVTPDTPILEAIRTLRTSEIGCLPVLENGRLVGVLTLFDLLPLSAGLLEDLLQK